MSTSYGLIIELSRNEKLQKYRIFLICLLLLFYFSEKFLNACKTRTSKSPLTAWPTWIGILWKWASMLTKLPGDGECRLALFHTIRNFLVNEFIIFQGCPTKLPSYLGSLLLIRPLYRSWDYAEHFGIYSQLNRKNKTSFFILLNVYVSWIEREKNLISQLSSPKFRYFAGQNGPKDDPIKMNFDKFQM